jgi:hypothetical protein
MKNLMIAIALTLSMMTADAQTLTGCFGVQFSATQQQVKESMKQKYPEAELIREDDKILGYTGGTWAGKKAYIWVFSFTSKGLLHTASISLKPSNDPQIWELYEDISKDLAEKYGMQTGEREKWLYPYNASDKYSHGITALKLGKADIRKTWFFENETPSTDDDNALQISITDDIHVNVRYQDGKLIQEVVKENAEKRKGDL